MMKRFGIVAAFAVRHLSPSDAWILPVVPSFQKNQYPARAVRLFAENENEAATVSLSNDDVSVPYDAASRLAYETSDKSLDYEEFRSVYEEEAIAFVKSKQPQKETGEAVPAEKEQQPSNSAPASTTSEEEQVPAVKQADVSEDTVSATVRDMTVEAPSTDVMVEKSPSVDDARSGSSNDLINDFCQGTNEFWKGLVIQPVKDYVAIQPAGTAPSDPWSKLTAPPEIPGISRPVWLVILGSVPTALGWYGYYKFSIEEELYQYELQQEGRVSGCGGYGTLFPFVYGVIVGFPLSVLGIPLGDLLLESAAFWILAGQVNLYRRVNELCTEDETIMKSLNLTQAPLYEWWALLPPPLDVVVGLRQVHFLSEYWRVIRQNESEGKDVIAQDLFPFISSDRFTLRQFFLEPKRWFWFTSEWEDLEQLKEYWKE
mmetsp:Transcript_23120/g.48157  ORF Transcript_23120/g.48157 Transcript_23120/m.48157 type:complete len:429 (-) Transcript_23120:158-1444(-)